MCEGGEPDADGRAALRCTFACEVRATAKATAAGPRAVERTNGRHAEAAECSALAITRDEAERARAPDFQGPRRGAGMHRCRLAGGRGSREDGRPWSGVEPWHCEDVYGCACTAAWAACKASVAGYWFCVHVPGFADREEQERRTGSE